MLQTGSGDVMDGAGRAAIPPNEGSACDFGLMEGQGGDFRDPGVSWSR